MALSKNQFFQYLESLVDDGNLTAFSGDFTVDGKNIRINYANSNFQVTSATEPNLETFILQLVLEGYNINLSIVEGELRFNLNNFGLKENGCCYLVKTKEGFDLFGRYNKLATITSVEDLNSEKQALEDKYIKRMHG